MKRKYTPSPNEIAQVARFVDAFLLPRFRDRFRDQPAKLYDAMDHVLPSKLDGRLVVVIPRTIGDSDIIEAVSKITRRTTAFCLGFGVGDESRDRGLEDALFAVSINGGAAAVIEPGVLAYYATETPSDRYLLIADDKSRSVISSALKRWW